MRSLIGLFILVGVSSLSLRAEARVDIQNSKRLFMPVDVSEPIVGAETSRRMQPQSVEVGESGSSVVSKIVDNSFSIWWEKSPVRQTSVGQAAEKVEQNLKAEVEFGKNSESKTEHKLGIKVLAMQSLARLEYKGWVKAGINYNLRAATTDAEVSENISANKDLVISHRFSTSENNSQVSFRWNW